MTRYTLTIPTVDYDGRPRADFPRAAEILLADAGVEGWTSVDGTGAWRQYREPVRVYWIDDDDELEPRLVRAAGLLAAYAQQEVVYLTAGGRAILVHPYGIPEAAA